jgi:3-oxoacyl-[acyl-carrier-protein] synthase III
LGGLSTLNFSGIEIVSSGGFLPNDKITNLDLKELYLPELDIDFIQSNVGIYSRHFANSTYHTSDLGYEASKIAFENSSIKVSDIDRIILCTTTPDHLSPATACKIQKLLSAYCPAEDKNSSCAGFLFGLDHAIRLLKTGLKNVLLIGADIKSRFVRKDDKTFLPIFADGAGAFLLSNNETSRGFSNIILWTDGTGYEDLYTVAGGSALPASIETVQNNLHSIQMFLPGRKIFEHAVNQMILLIKQVCSEINLDISDIDILIPHQANLLIIKEVIKQLNFPIQKTILTIDFTGNTVTATLPFAYYFAKKQNRIKSGDKILFVTVGSGYSGGACIYEE